MPDVHDLNDDLRVLIACDRDRGLPEHLRSDSEFCRLVDKTSAGGFSFWMSGRAVSAEFFYQCLRARVEADALAEHDEKD